MSRGRCSTAMMRIAAMVAVTILSGSFGGFVPAQARGPAHPAEVLEAFHAALASGDSAAACALLAADAIVLESGAIETREEYVSHHLGADMAFAAAVATERGNVRAVLDGDAAWVSATSISKGMYRGREIDSFGAELVILSYVEGGWKIRAIHWSSRPAR